MRGVLNLGITVGDVEIDRSVCLAGDKNTIKARFLKPEWKYASSGGLTLDT